VCSRCYASERASERASEAGRRLSDSTAGDGEHGAGGYVWRGSSLSLSSSSSSK